MYVSLQNSIVWNTVILLSSIRNTTLSSSFRNHELCFCTHSIEYALATEFPLSWKINWISKYWWCFSCCRYWYFQVLPEILRWWYSKKEKCSMIDRWIFCCSHYASALEELAEAIRNEMGEGREEIERREKWFIECIDTTYIIETIVREREEGVAKKEQSTST